MSARQKIALVMLVALTWILALVGGIEARTKLVWWNSWTDSQEMISLLNGYVKQFQTENPEVDIELQFIAYDKIGEKFSTAYAANAAPDVVMLLPYDYTMLATQGALVPLTPYLSKHNINMKTFVPMDVERAVINGVVYGLPHMTAAAQRFIVYDKNVFAEAGLPNRAPATWSELRTYTQRTSKYDAAGKPQRLGYVDYTGDWWVPFLYSNSGQLFLNGGKSATFNTPQVYETASYVKDLIDMQGGAAAVKAFTRNKFELGQRSIIAGNQATLKSIMIGQIDREAIGIGVWPYNEQRPGSSGHGVTTAGGWFMAIPKGLSREKEEAAFRWLAFMTARKDGGATFAMSQGRPSALISVNYSRQYYETNPAWDQLIKVLETDVALPLTPVTDKVMKIINDSVTAIVAGTTATQAALEDAQRRADVIMAEWLSK